jgi:hypothetical protein
VIKKGGITGVYSADPIISILHRRRTSLHKGRSLGYTSFDYWTYGGFILDIRGLGNYCGGFYVN